MELLVQTLEALGSIFIGYAALRVHHRVLGERSIDQKVLRVMRFEQFIGWTGVAMIIVGYGINFFIS